MIKGDHSKKRHVALVFGGVSEEHEVSIMTARSVYAAIDSERYRVTLIGISKQGNWHVVSASEFAQESFSFASLANEVRVTPLDSSGRALRLAGGPALPPIDVVLPLVHGPGGEDGTLQAIFSLGSLPFVGAGVLGSAVGMDKDVAKRLLREADIPVARGEVWCRSDSNSALQERAERLGGFPLFVKPANMGSSVGVSRAENLQELDDACSLAFQYDEKLLIEECIVGREIEYAVLQKDQTLIVSAPGEIGIGGEFYSYDRKYCEGKIPDLILPAEVSQSIIEKMQACARQVFTTLECRGLARVDFFLKSDGSFLVNEINTIPGFTATSMYPKLMEHAGVSYTELLDILLVTTRGS